jgi:hypothetical protein
MLPLRKPGQTTINVSTSHPIRAFATHIVVNARRVPGGDGGVRHGADGGGRPRTGGVQIVAKVERK